MNLGNCTESDVLLKQRMIFYLLHLIDLLSNIHAANFLYLKSIFATKKIFFIVIFYLKPKSTLEVCLKKNTKRIRSMDKNLS